MSEEEKDGDGFRLWIDRKNRVISLRYAEGFEQLQFATHQEMFDFAIEKGYEGFGIQ